MPQSLETTAANVHDMAVASKLLREDDEVMYGDCDLPEDMCALFPKKGKK